MIPFDLVILIMGLNPKGIIQSKDLRTIHRSFIYIYIKPETTRKCSARRMVK